MNDVEGKKQNVPKAQPRTSGRRLIEEWLPITEIGIESLRERIPMTPFPAPNRLHVWWARRPLVASRAAVLASLLPADADHKKFLHALGIHGDPVAAKARMVAAGKNIDAVTGKRENLGANPWGYSRAFQHNPTEEDQTYLRSLGGNGKPPRVLDSTAGGGSIPFEAMRLGCDTIGNDLNPVAWLILKATAEFPAKFGEKLLKRYQQLSMQFVEKASSRFVGIFSPEPDGVTVDGYLWTRTIHCPYCGGLIPLSPNWKLNTKGVGVRVVPQVGSGKDRVCAFEIVHDAKDHSPGTVKGGDGLCPFPDCGRVIDGDEIKSQAQEGKMGEQLYAVIYDARKVLGYAKNGKPKIKKTRGFRSPQPEDDNAAYVQAALDNKMPEWKARGIYPDDEMPDGYRKVMRDCISKYGFRYWHEWFTARQMLGHCTSVEVFQELVVDCGGTGALSELDGAALAYLAIAIDKSIDYNSKGTRFEIAKQRLANTFARHDFAFKWSFAEMALCGTGLGYEWVTTAVGKALKELVELTNYRDHKSHDDGYLAFGGNTTHERLLISLSNESGDNLSLLSDASIDAVVIDPPYYANVSYAELSDFFYIWLKRTAGLIFPNEFSQQATDKDREAVANPWRFRDLDKKLGTVAKQAARDYQERMQAIFAEARRVLKLDGIMTLMFTHKATGAWDALAKGLVDAGFVITASWPIQTEAEGSLHIKDKNAAKSTIFLVCRPREIEAADSAVTYWEEVEPQVTAVVREKVAVFQAAGIGGVDLYLACFGPALQVFSEHWPMKRGRANQKPLPARGAQLQLIEDEDWDPYAIRPEDALMAARTAVKQWRLQQLATVKRQAHLDAVTEFVVLAWDAYRSPQFPADEAIKLARVVGVNFDEQLKNKVLEVKGGDVILWDSGQRAKKGSLGSMGNDCKLDSLHQAAQTVRERNVGVARDMVQKADLHKDSSFLMALETMLNVLPTPRMVGGKGTLAGAAADAEAMEKLRKLMFDKEVPQAKQWLLFEPGT